MVAKRVAQSVSLLASCSLARSAAGGCAWCGTRLPKRRRTWCSDRCSAAFWNNHWWTLARRAAKRRDKYSCKRCGHALPKRPSRSACSSEKAYRAAMRLWRSERRAGRLEVNHRDPCRGQHGRLSCAHHLDNLETLCVSCHKEHTSAIPRRNQRVSP